MSVPWPRVLAALLFPLLVPAAGATPTDDPLVELFLQVAGAEGVDAFQGDGRWSHLDLARKAMPLLDGTVEVRDRTWWSVHRRFEEGLAPEIQARGAGPVTDLVAVARPALRGTLGTLPPANLDGDPEAGLLAGRLTMEVAACTRWLEVSARPVLALDALGAEAAPAPWLPEAWVAGRWSALEVGFGRRSRWFGPGRRGSLLVSDNALAAPMGTAVLEGRLPGRGERWGRFRLEAGAGWLDRPRADVDHPALLLVDARWLPVPWVELGATRLSLFGGAGRPVPSLGQLLLPTAAEAGDDGGEHLLPDQDELVSLDARVVVPVRRGPVNRVEAWWQHGAEDLVTWDLGGLVLPAFSGTADLGGVELGIGPWTLGAEGARTLDPDFRWYTGHPVYGDGFTQDGRVMGHWIGGDGEALQVWLSWFPRPWRWGVEATWDEVRQVGVVEARDGEILALATDQHRHLAGVRLWHLGSRGATWAVGYRMELVEGAGFVPDATARNHHLWVQWRSLPVWTGGPRG